MGIVKIGIYLCLDWPLCCRSSSAITPTQAKDVSCLGWSRWPLWKFLVGTLSVGGLILSLIKIVTVRAKLLEKPISTGTQIHKHICSTASINIRFAVATSSGFINSSFWAGLMTVEMQMPLVQICSKFHKSRTYSLQECMRGQHQYVLYNLSISRAHDRWHQQL